VEVRRRSVKDRAAARHAQGGILADRKPVQRGHTRGLLPADNRVDLAPDGVPQVQRRSRYHRVDAEIVEGDPRAEPAGADRRGRG
jgi:hypothetical protein